MELKFELNTRLTVSCVVAVTSAYGLVTILIALDSVLLAFSNAVTFLMILFVLFGWKELLGVRIPDCCLQGIQPCECKRRKAPKD
jgi:hypothetical protein